MAEEGEKTISRKKYGGVRRRLTVAQSIGDELEQESSRAGSKVGAGIKSDDESDKYDSTRRGSQRNLEAHPALMGMDPTVSCSIQGTLTSKDMFVPFFSNKAIKFSGLDLMKNLNLGVVCHRGQKPEYSNQDDFFFFSLGSTLIYGVMDGHGGEGEQISNFCQSHLPQFLLRDGLDKLIGQGADIEQKLTQAFADTQALLQKELPKQCLTSGCTATVVIQCPVRNKVWVANVGDSTAIIARRPKGQKGQFQAQALSVDHKPNAPEERERIEASGGGVQEPAQPGLPWRLVTPEAGLAVSRSMGDCQCSKYGLSSIPEIQSYEIDDEKEDYFILACSDGVWEFLNFAQVAQMCAKFDPTDAQNAAEKLTHKAQLRWQEQESVVDDITVILVWGGYDVTLFPKSEKAEPIAQKCEESEEKPPEAEKD